MNIQTYGGGLWRTWFDRDLGVAGKIIIQSTDESGNKHLSSKLWDSKDAVLSVPSLCIHLESAEQRAKFEINKETHLKPILATKVIDSLMGEAIKDDNIPDVYNVKGKNFETFLTRIADDLGITVDQIVDFELSMYDAHKPAIVGLHQEFVASPRLDNLASSLASLDALIAHHQSGDKDNKEVSMIMLFDHEEVGSQSAQGADSNMLVESTERIMAGLNPNLAREDYYRAIRRSFFVNADMAHAIHPNYAEKH
jgi:aspartyl aminopeptidase